MKRLSHFFFYFGRLAASVKVGEELVVEVAVAVEVVVAGQVDGRRGASYLAGLARICMKFAFLGGGKPPPFPSGKIGHFWGG